MGSILKPDSSQKVGGEDSDWRFKIGKYRVSYQKDTTWRMMLSPYQVLYHVYYDRSVMVVLKIGCSSDSSSSPVPEQTAAKANANP